MNSYTNIVLDHFYIGRDFNIHLKDINGIESICRLNKHSLDCDSVKRIYSEFIEYYTESEGIFSGKIQKIISELDSFFAEEVKKRDINWVSNSDGVEFALSSIKEYYSNDNKRTAYINYLQGCLLQIKFDFLRGYSSFQEACNLDVDIKYLFSAGELALKIGRPREA